MNDLETKVCVKCKEPKPLDEFVKCKDRPNGIRNHCRPCGRKQTTASYHKHATRYNAERRAKVAADPEKHRAYFKKYYEDNADKIYAQHLQRLYGITPEKLDDIINRQDGKCPICLLPLTKPVIDHDHRCCSGKESCGKCVRGALCGKCNAGIGLLGDNPDALLRAAQYVLTQSTHGGK